MLLVSAVLGVQVPDRVTVTGTPVKVGTSASWQQDRLPIHRDRPLD